MPVPDYGFKEKPKRIACFGQQNIISASTVVIYCASLSLSVSTYNTLSNAIDLYPSCIDYYVPHPNKKQVCSVLTSLDLFMMLQLPLVAPTYEIQRSNWLKS